MPQKYITIDGVATMVHHRGRTTLPGRPPDTSTGRAVLCLHDAGGNGNEFAGVLDALSVGACPVAYDQPGHGRSGSLDSLADISKMAAFTRALADAVGLQSPVLLGEGLGAGVALEAAISDPGWAHALVLVGGAAARFDIPEDVVIQLRAIAGGKARREFDRSGYAPDAPREVYQRAFAEWVRTDPRVTVGDREAQRSWDATARVGAVRCPVVAVVGQHEDASARAAAEALVKAVPNGRLVEIAGAGRRGVLEQPDALAAIVTEVSS